MVLVIVWLNQVILTEINGSHDFLAEPREAVDEGPDPLVPGLHQQVVCRFRARP